MKDKKYAKIKDNDRFNVIRAKEHYNFCRYNNIKQYESIISAKNKTKYWGMKFNDFKHYILEL